MWFSLPFPIPIILFSELSWWCCYTSLYKTWLMANQCILDQYPLWKYFAFRHFSMSDSSSFIILQACFAKSAFKTKLNNTSTHRINSYGDKESPLCKPLLDLKESDKKLFNRVEKEIKEIHLIISSTQSMGKPIINMTFSKYHHSTIS